MKYKRALPWLGLALVLCAGVAFAYSSISGQHELGEQSARVKTPSGLSVSPGEGDGSETSTGVAGSVDSTPSTDTTLTPVVSTAGGAGLSVTDGETTKVFTRVQLKALGGTTASFSNDKTSFSGIGVSISRILAAAGFKVSAVKGVTAVCSDGFTTNYGPSLLGSAIVCYSRADGSALSVEDAPFRIVLSGSTGKQNPYKVVKLVVSGATIPNDSSAPVVDPPDGPPAASSTLQVTNGTSSKTYTKTALQSIGAVNVSVSLKNKSTGLLETHTYKCVALSAVLSDAGFTGATKVTATCSDGFTSDYTSPTGLYIAYAYTDGSALAASEGPFRVVLPGGEGNQNPYWVVKISVTAAVVPPTPPTPPAPTLLVTDGSTSKTYTAAQLLALGSESVSVSLKNPDGTYTLHTYKSVRLSTVLANAGYSDAATATAVASDGFASAFSAADIALPDTMVAYANPDGTALADAEGPFRVVMPAGGGKKNPRNVVRIDVTAAVVPPTPPAPTLLVTDGSTSKTYTAAQLLALGSESVSVSLKNPDGTYTLHTYKSVRLSTVLANAGYSDAATATAVASDGFASAFSAADIALPDTMVAYANPDGTALAASEGPFRVVMPAGGGKKNPRNVVRIDVTAATPVGGTVPSCVAVGTAASLEESASVGSPTAGDPTTGDDSPAPSEESTAPTPAGPGTKGSGAEQPPASEPEAPAPVPEPDAPAPASEPEAPAPAPEPEPAPTEPEPVPEVPALATDASSAIDAAPGAS